MIHLMLHLTLASAQGILVRRSSAFSSRICRVGSFVGICFKKSTGNAGSGLSLVAIAANEVHSCQRSGVRFGQDWLERGPRALCACQTVVHLMTYVQQLAEKGFNR